jgi:hypothetical protein
VRAQSNVSRKLNPQGAKLLLAGVFFLSFFLFCDRKRKKKPTILSAFPEKHPGGVFFNISLINLKISAKLISLFQTCFICLSFMPADLPRCRRERY